MKAVILAGGLGTRIQEETHLRPKPMIEIGGKPILWHIMKMYSSHDINDFVIKRGKHHENFYNLIGIDSPGLTSSLAIAEYLSKIIKN